MWYNGSMSENIIVALITLFGTLVGVFVGFAGKAKKQAVNDAIREQQQTDRFSELTKEMSEIKKRLDIHNNYAEKFGEVKECIISIQKDIEYLRKGKK